MSTKLLFLSDMHLNSTSNLHSDQEIYNFFTKYLSRGYNIVLVGDIFDLIKNECIENKRKRELLAIKGLFPQTYNLIETNENIYLISGNHDYYVYKNKSLEKVASEINFKIGPFVVHTEHGHKFDLPNSSTCHKIGDTVSCCFGNIQENCKKEFADKIETLGDLDNTHKKLKIAAKKLLKNYDFVVFGHSHNLYLKLYGQKAYINSGCFKKEKVDITTMKFNDDFPIIKQKQINI